MTLTKVLQKLDAMRQSSEEAALKAEKKAEARKRKRHFLENIVVTETKGLETRGSK